MHGKSVVPSNYTMHHKKDHLITEGEFATHVSEGSHRNEDLEFEVFGIERNWTKRGIKRGH